MHAKEKTGSPHPQLAVFLPALSAGGAERVVLVLLAEFVRLGLRCDLVCAGAHGPWRDRVPDGVRLVDLRCRKPLTSVLALWRYLRREQPDVILSSILSANLALLMAACLPGVRSRIVIREANVPYLDAQSRTALRTGINRWAQRLLFPRADAVIALSHGAVRELQRSAPRLSTDAIHVIPNPVRSSTQTSRHAPPFASASGKLVLACGRLEPQKDFATLLRAFARLPAELAARLVLIGEGSERSRLEREAVALGISAQITFAGHDSNPRAWMRKADLFVLSSRWEGFPNVLLEALAEGCPVVSTDSSDAVGELLDGDRYGLQVPVADADALAEAMKRVLAGGVSFESGEKHLYAYAPETIARRYLAVLLPEHPLSHEAVSCAA